MRIWSRFLYAGQKTFSASSRGRWAGLVEIGIASILILGGFVFFVAILAIQYLFSDSAQQTWAYTTVQLVIRITLATLALGIGMYRLFAALLKVNTSQERRLAMASAAGETESFSDGRGNEIDLPSVPKPIKPPVRGQKLPWRLVGRRRNYGWLFLSGVAMLASLTMATLSTARFSFSFRESLDWAALAIAVFSSAIGVWSSVTFFRHALRLAAFGPTTLEISDFPLIPGRKYRILLRQPGRFRFKLLNVLLICEEITTFTRGTDIQTERRTVEEHRLMRQRGVNVTTQEPFESEFEFEMPASSFHSFVSKNNQVQWKIVVQTLAKGWPQFEQTFPVVVCPPGASAS
ncbi:MAG: hypothetical protein ABL888_12970 [Pirellulaceae bacterium]